MKSIITNSFLLAALWLVHLTSLPAQGTSSFPAPKASSASYGIPVILQFTCSIRNNRVLVNWIADNNENTDRFELERSSNGKKFETAALLFGTDKPGTDTYGFYEKARAKKTFYRIRIIQKNHTTVYSSVLIAGKNS